MRYLTDDLPGTGGRIKEAPSDFCVEEIPLYPPCGQGAHTFFEVRKVGISTFEAMRRVARALGIRPGEVAYAGLKDAQAVTTQVFSVERVRPERVLALELPGIEVQWAKRHRQSLKVGHLHGNRFTIRIRGAGCEALDACRAILDTLSRRGVPNAFGPQRFGMRGNSALLGRAILRHDAGEFVRELVGSPRTGESPAVQEARSCADAGDWEGALRLYPGSMADERGVVLALRNSGGDVARAYAAVPKRLKGFFLSAYQSELFNRVLDQRLERLDQVVTGDLAMKHPWHSIFRVEDEDIEQARAARFEISATGPIFGYKMMRPTGWPGELEAAILAGQDLEPEAFRVGEGLQLRGERRALRFQANDLETWYDEGIMLRFWLAPGCYATALLGEVMKAPTPEEATENVSELTKL
ncbi:MAG TPA: tRNA pseudouridine(13) synthase TruD [Anaerolineae bacterium]|nr:tRNA pseudouridine(13) synthase TruD [Anaerolineae bacterium]